ncbi:MAG: YciI family protein [Gallionella sp.]|nr:YciI family protein [Gallionella sp.]MDP1940022.1 YciI family protein [Gallionella sp.]
MWYAIVGHDVPDSLNQRLSSRPAHVARLQLLQTQGRLLLAGPFPAVDAEDPGTAGYTGSLIVAEFASLSAAQDWANADPYLSGGVYERVSVQPFKKAFPA